MSVSVAAAAGAAACFKAQYPGCCSALDCLSSSLKGQPRFLFRLSAFLAHAAESRWGGKGKGSLLSWGTPGLWHCPEDAELDFPMPELILATGFLLVLVTEHVVLACSEQHLDEATLPLLPCPSHHQHREEAASAGRHPGLGEAPGPGSSEGRSPASPFRSLVLTLSLSLHSVFEGLAVGLQEAEAKVLQLAVAILLHKSLIAFSLALLLLQSRLPLRWLTASVATFALMSPLGVGLGMVVTHSPSPDSATARSLLEGVAAGTFMYITFLEILPQELSAPASRLPKVLAVLLGFSGMAGLRLLG
ncbi:zinc transporter ZIP1-like isoform X3 [Hemicordylus capensis]|uniref:zinc transporter ZIP1-like isoform X3 n=1 Tax=Hemicordylus capensis TaxID=884348 RepID=UPI002302D6F1|nr:zinc transporter ZIP1-like isoform X3 [Hemicordylus capensis]